MKKYSMDEIDEIFYGLENDMAHEDENKSTTKKSEKIEEKLNFLGLTKKEMETIYMIIFYGIFISLFVGSLIGYMNYYFAL